MWFEAIVAHAPDAIVVLDVESGRFVIVNPQAERLFGMSAAQLHEVGPAGVSPPLQPDGRSSAEAARAFIELAARGETPRFDWVHRHADGTLLSCEVNLLRLPCDEATLVRGSIVEVGERRRIEDAFRFLVSTSSDLISRHAPDGTWRYVSPASRRLGGYEPAELVGRHPDEFVHPDDRDRMRAVQQAVLERGDVESLTCRWRRKDGQYFWLESTMLAVRDGSTGEVVEIHTASREVTRRMEAEEALRRERDLSAALIASLPDGVAVIDGKGRVVEVNERWCAITGLERDEVLGQRQPHRWWPPEHHKRLTAFFDDVRAGRAVEIVLELMRATGERFPALISVSVLPGPAYMGSLVAVLKDLTQWTRAQAAHKASEERFEALVAQAPVGIFMCDERGDNVYANERLQQLIGRSDARIRGRAWVDHVHPSDRNRVVSSWYAAVSAGEEWSAEYRVITGDGAVRRAEASGRPLHGPEGRITGFLGTYIDVTERREAEEARRRAAVEQAAREEAHTAAADLRRLLEETPAIVWVFRGPEHVIEVTNARARQSVCDREPLIGLPFHKAIPEAAEEGIFALLDHVYATNEPVVETERRVAVVRDGQQRERFYNSVLQPTRDPDGQATGIYAHIVDVTDQVQARRQAEEAEARLRSLVGGLAAIVWEADPATWRFTFVSDRAEELLGYPVEQWSEPGFWVSIVHPEDRDGSVTYCATETNAGRDHDFSYRAIAADGRTVWLHDIIHVITAEDGTVVAMQGVMIDITEWKRAEQELVSSEARFRLVADAAPMLIRTFDAAGHCVFCNQGWSDFTGRRMCEPGDDWTVAVHPADLDGCLAAYQSAFAAHKPFEREHRLRRHDDVYRWVLDRGVPMLGEGGEFRGYISGCVDITERKRAEWASGLLAESGRLLVDQAPVGQHLQALARLAVPGLGELCVIALQQEDGTLHRTAVAHVRPELEQVVRDLPPPDPASSLFEAIRTQRPVPVTTGSGEASEWRALGLAKALVVPLVAHGRTFGSIAFGTSDPLLSYGLDDVVLGEEWARRVALALDTMTLHSRTEQLQVIAAALASAATLEEVASAVLDGACKALGAFAGYVYQVESGGSLALVGFAGWPKEAMADWWTLDPEQPSPAVDAALTVAPVWLESAAAWRPRYPGLDAPGGEGAAVVPLVLKGKAIGVVGLFFTGPRMLRPDERAFVLTLAEQCAQAFERARLYEEQRAIAHILQQSLLPSRRPKIPQLELAARYRPLGTAVEAGGDFYDIFETSRGWDFVIGDVCGKGPEAAQLTALCRYALRAAALQGPDDPPSRLLGLLNRVIISYQPDSSQFSTVAYASLRTDGDRLRLVVASGGHPPVLVLRHDGAIESVKPAGCLLGLVPDAFLEDAWVELEPGDLVLLYTDGVTESRRDGVLFGEQRLAHLAAESAGRSVEDLLLRIEQAAVDFQDGPLRDDLALLGLRVRDVAQTATPRALDLSFPAIPEALTTLRGRLHDWLTAHGITRTQSYPLLLAGTEAATNAIVHGYDGGDSGAHFGVRGMLRNGEVTLVVTDSGGWKEPGRTEGGRGISIMSRLMDGVEVIPSPRGTEVPRHRGAPEVAPGRRGAAP